MLSEREITEKTISRLELAQVSYEHLTHEPTPRSIDSAKVRGMSLDTGVKALIFEGRKSGKFCMVCVRGDMRVNSTKVQAQVGEKIFMASPEKILATFGLQIGGIPPRAQELGIEGYFDEKILEKGTVAFNCGSRTESIIMQSKDLVILFPNLVGDTRNRLHNDIYSSKMQCKLF